jgi:predicted ATPase/class 3 adenylate cyclase/Tfp pilus assembly protein PilF
VTHSDLPKGTVTFLFTDIEGSTALWERDRAAMREAVARHLAILHGLIEAHHGVLYKTVGDGTQAAFASAEDALRAAVAAQRALLTEVWAEPPGAMRVRIALHAGEAEPDGRGEYLAAPLNRLARLLSTGYGGQILLSQVVQQLSRGGLPPGTKLRDLGEHRLRDLLEPEQIFQVLHPDLPDQLPPLTSLGSHPTNLPLQPTPFLGREREVQQVVDQVRRPEVRFLTLTGPGGTGKTRLALQAAAELLDDFPDGVYFVPLAALTDPVLVPSTIASTLGLREAEDQPITMSLQTFLVKKRLLLVLDNVEHLMEAAPAIGDLLVASPGLRVLATSRMPLRLRAEREYPVPPLGLPRRKPPPTLEQLSQYDAVRLFIERAQAVKPDFAVDNQTAPAVAEICHRLDGLPLAIELATARVRMLPPQAMLTRLEQRLPFLTGGARDAPERQRTLRNTIAWSYDLLPPAEQYVFRQLAVFAGGMTLEAAEAVANHDGHRDIFASMEQLVQQNLLRQDAATSLAPRYSMLETIREFGLEQLAVSSEEDAARARHATSILTLVRVAGAGMHGPQQHLWMDCLETELDNIRSALGWSLTQEPETALRLMAALCHEFWAFRGYISEGRDWIERALAIRATATPQERARVLSMMSSFAADRKDYTTASARAEEALVLARSVDDSSSEGWALLNLGLIAGELGNWKKAMALYAEAESRFRSIGERHGVAMALLNQGIDAGVAGEVLQRQRLLEQSLAECRAIGDRIEASWVLSTLGHVALEQGQLDQAQTFLEEALATAREFRFGLMEARILDDLAEVAADQGDSKQVAMYLQTAEDSYRALGYTPYLANGLNRAGYLMLRQGDNERARQLVEEAVALARESEGPSGVASYVHSLGDVLRASGDARSAALHYREALSLAQQVSDSMQTTSCLTGLAGLAVDTGRYEVAARLFGAMEALRETVGLPGSRYEEARLGEDMAAVHQALGHDADIAARTSGRDLSRETVVGAALALVEELQASATT